MQVNIVKKRKNDEAPEKVYLFPVKVYYEDTDAVGVVYYANYLRYLERARSQALEKIGFTHKYLRQQNALVVVKHVTISYDKPALLEDHLSVCSTISQVRRVGMSFSQQIFRQDTLIVSAQVDLACITLEGKVRSWPDLMAQKMNLIQTEGDT